MDSVDLLDSEDKRTNATSSPNALSSSNATSAPNATSVTSAPNASSVPTVPNASSASNASVSTITKPLSNILMDSVDLLDSEDKKETPSERSDVTSGIPANAPATPANVSANAPVTPANVSANAPVTLANAPATLANAPATPANAPAITPVIAEEKKNFLANKLTNVVESIKKIKREKSAIKEPPVNERNAKAETSSEYKQEPVN